jgi:elongation factor P--beta-lysine ligase
MHRSRRPRRQGVACGIDRVVDIASGCRLTLGDDDIG